MERIYELLKSHNMYPVQGVYDAPTWQGVYYENGETTTRIGDYVKYITSDSVVLQLRRRPNEEINVFIYDMKVPCTVFNQTLSVMSAMEQICKILHI